MRSWRLPALLLGTALIVVGLLALRQSAASQPRILRPPVQIISPDALATPSAPPAVAIDGMRVRVPALAIDLPVVPGNGVNAPLYTAALDTRLAVPGQGKRSLIYAHPLPGMFRSLSRAAVGQRIEIDRRGSPPLYYVIREYYPSWSATDLSWLDPLGREQLILETGTTYDTNDPRIIAVAEPA
jgi:sortase (surface protein transpeptidase)